MQPTIKVEKQGPGADGLEQILRDLQNMQVYVGIPEDKAGREKSKVNNAQLMFIHTHGVRSEEMKKATEKGGIYSAAKALYLRTKGSPLWRIPPRPVIEPAIEAKDNKEAICHELELAAKAIFKRDKIEAMRHLQRAGMEAQNRVRAWFTDSRNGWAPNSPATIARKGSDRPLIDEDEMRKSVVYVVKED